MNRPQTFNLDTQARTDSVIPLRNDKKSIFNGNQSAAVIIDGAAGRNKIMVAGKRFHLIGAGGVGMSGLAVLLMKNNAIVTGSDQTPTQVTKHLCGLGADIKIGHNAANLDPETDAVVISAAITEANPELKLARQKGLHCL